MKMKLLLLAVCSMAAWGQCPASITTATGTVCLVGPAGPQGVPGPAGAQGPQGIPGPAGAGISTITVLPTGDTQVKGNLIVTGTLTTGAPGIPTVWTIIRTDGVSCTAKFSPTNPASNTTSMVITCP
jgi:hypothetical protein